MFNTTDVLTLGTDYTVTDRKGNVLKSIQVIAHGDILDATLGDYDPIEHGTFSDYLEKSIAVLTGFEGVDPLRTLWYTSYDEEVILTDIIEFAIKNGYNKVIIEHLDEFFDGID